MIFLVHTTPLRHHLMPESMIDNLIVAVTEVRLDSRERVLCMIRVCQGLLYKVHDRRVH